VTYLKNRNPTTSLHNKTPFEAWYGNKPDIGNLHIFGCLAYHHVEGPRRKLEEKSVKCRFLGYEGLNKYRLCEGHRVIVSSHVLWDEVSAIEGEDYDDDDYAHISVNSDTTQGELLSIDYYRSTSVEDVDIDENKETDNGNEDEGLIEPEAQSSTDLDHVGEPEPSSLLDTVTIRRPPRRKAAGPSNYDILADSFNVRWGGNINPPGFQGQGKINTAKKGFAVRILKAKIKSDYPTYFSLNPLG